MSIKKSFKLNRIAVAVMLATTAAVPQIATAGAGWGDTTNPANLNGKMQTYSASSPTGMLPVGSCFDFQGNPSVAIADCDTGLAIRKFVDTLPGLTAAGANNLGNYIPTAVADQLAFPGNDYYEIAVIEYTQRLHSDLFKPTTLRGYVQIDPAATDIAGGVTRPAGLPAANAPAGSKAIALFNADGSAAMISRPDTASASGYKLVQAYGVDNPHYLGPVITAQQGRPTRLTFYNALPVGRADYATGARHGDLFLPVDETLPGAGYGPDGKVKYTQNRALIHLHGGDNPWISDGTPHQWITPAGEATAANGVAAEALAKGANAANYLRGPGASNVPDMADPGPGASTYYYPNGLSARMEWYHDHAFGLTRYNVFAGEASAYLVRDTAEAGLIAGALAGVPEIPLVIQDKNFVPKNVAIQDAFWDAKYWGSEGDLYYPHVWETNQDPNSLDATNPVGRWDWGPFFWPVFPSAMDLPTGEHKIYDPSGSLAAAGVTGPLVTATRNSWTNLQTASTLDGPSVLGLTEVTTTPEAFVDTPMVNGVAYPSLTVEPKAYRLRFLNAANDRMFNLGFYLAADKNTVIASTNGVANDPLTAYATTLVSGDAGASTNPLDLTEVRMVPFIGPNGPTATTVQCDATGNTPVTSIYKTSFPCAGGLMGTGWGTQDNRPGGVPDPKTAGPSIWQIGNEGGFVPAPLEIPSTPFNYEYNKRSVTVLNVLEHGLFLSTAQRADTVVDFSAYAGKTLILYNDSSAPVPAGDPRLDYYTLIGDQTPAGGAPDTLPGYGPNTRTVMQVVVGTSVTGPAQAKNAAGGFDFAGLSTAVTGAYAATQSKPIVGQTAYQPAFGTAAPYNVDVFAHIFTGTIYLAKYNALNFTTTDSLTYTPAPGSTVPGGWKFTNAAGTLTNVVPQCNTAALCQPLVDLVKKAGPATVPALTPVSAYVENKTIQELFDPTWGRMNATLGVELPFVTSLTQTTIPLGYVDPATETVADGETQIWKITHNGVDSHPVHFHLVNVQVINRVGWDGTNKGAYAEEAGWKETVRMNPLEDVIVAVRAKKPALPFGLPHSYRALDPSQPIVDPITGGAVITGFTQVDPITGNPATVANKFDDFMDEYVWHCHILGHEENDFMRPVKFDSKNVKVPAFTVTSAAAAGNAVTVTWVDPTPVTTQVINGVTSVVNNPAAEIGYRVERATGNVAVGGAGFAALGTPTAQNAITGKTNVLANVTSYVDATAAAPLVPTAAVLNSVVLNAAGTSATLSFSGAANQSSFNIVRNGVTIKTGLAAGTTSYVDSTVTGLGVTYTYQVVAVAADNTYSYRVIGVNAAGETTSTNDAQAVLAGSSVGSNTVSVTTPNVSLAQATGLTANLISLGSAQLSFADNSTGETGYQVQACFGSGTQCTAAAATSATFVQNRWYTVPAANATFTNPVGTGAATAVVNVPMNANNGRYYFRVSPLNGATVGTVSASTVINLGSQVATPTGVTAVAGVGSATLSWTDAANNNASYQVQQRSVGSVKTVATTNNYGTYTVAPTATVAQPNLSAAQGGVRATVTVSLAAGKLVFTVTNPGAGYTSAPQITITGGTRTGTAPTAAATSNLNFGVWTTTYNTSTTTPAALNGIATGATVTGLTAGTAYQFQVTGVQVANGGGSSNAVTTAAVIAQ